MRNLRYFDAKHQITEQRKRLNVVKKEEQI